MKQEIDELLELKDERDISKLPNQPSVLLEAPGRLAPNLFGRSPKHPRRHVISGCPVQKVWARYHPWRAAKERDICDWGRALLLLATTLWCDKLSGCNTTELPTRHTMSEAARLKCTVYVGGLDQAVTVQTLAEAFVPFGEVVDITLPKPDVPNSNELQRGFGYVEFEVPEDAKEAIDNMDGSELYGRTIKEGYLAKYAVDEEDKLAAEQAQAATNDRPHDPMQGLEELDVAGPKPE
ncbi:unnamed protein product [Aspergillus oryzae]|nr:unnamed protein product [Aspergillus oryzae]